MDRMLSFVTDGQGNVSLFDENAEVVLATRTFTSDSSEDDYFDGYIAMLNEAREMMYP